LGRAAELRYGRMVELGKELSDAESKLAELQQTGQMLKEEVGEDDVAEVVGKWTGIPVSRLLEGEVQKLISMEERLHDRVVGQEQAIEAVSSAVRRARAGLQDLTARSEVFCSWARPAWERPNWRERSPSSSLSTSKP
jgi:ATP-dependent Clp protease ATP-binding subunit ClpB